MISHDIKEITKVNTTNVKGEAAKMAPSNNKSITITTVGATCEMNFIGSILGEPKLFSRKASSNKKRDTMVNL